MIFEPMQKEHLTELAKMYVEAFNAPPWNDQWTIDWFQHLKYLFRFVSYAGA
jgi:hypothetical protein